MEYTLERVITDVEVFFLDEIPEDITKTDYKNNVTNYRTKEVYRLYDEDDNLIDEKEIRL